MIQCAKAKVIISFPTRVNTKQSTNWLFGAKADRIKRQTGVGYCWVLKYIVYDYGSANLYGIFSHRFVKTSFCSNER